MSKMIERVAEAIHQDRSTDRPWKDEQDTMKDFYRSCATAALKALRSPTAHMIEAGQPWSDYANIVWQEMIDEALLGDGSTSLPDYEVMKDMRKRHPTNSSVP